VTRPALGLALPLATRGGDAPRFVAELVDEVAAADAAGFDLCLVPEHHEARRASIVAPLTLCGALVARTTRIRIGTGILILPCHHPRHVAEQVTLLDQLSGGRIVLGVGAGYQPEDLEPFGVGMAERGARFEQALTELGALLSEGGGLRPEPVQRPRPPLWVGSWAAAGIRRAAALADGWIADPIRTTDEIAAMAARYREAAGDRGGTVVVMREAWVDSDPGARDRFAPVIAPVFDYYRRKGAAEIPPTFEEFVEDRFVIGSPEECVAQVEDLAERTGADVVALTIRHPGGPDHDTVVSAIGALGEAWSRQAVETAR
jgi:alkanesulfonate monooxygenase SsuD/methylene tetrahydromethanopterin reductase-like flavin-dependent oxidoreductase (luciferase family)